MTTTTVTSGAAWPANWAGADAIEQSMDAWLGADRLTTAVLVRKHGEVKLRPEFGLAMAASKEHIHNVNLNSRMDTPYLYYTSGEEVHAGDRVQHKGSFATVVFVSTGESEEFSPGYEDYTGAERGVLLCDDDGGTTFVGEPDEMLEFVDRA